MAIHGTLKSAVTVTAGLDFAAVTGKGWFYGITVSGAAGAVIIYDAASATGTVLMQANGLGHYFLPVPIPFTIGVFVNDAASQIITVYYQAGP